MPPASPVVSASSLVNLLASFVSVLDEPGLRAARGDECVRIIVEALLRLDENALAESGVETLRDGVQSYLSSRRIEKDLFADESTKAQWQDVRLPSRSLFGATLLTQFATRPASRAARHRALVGFVV